MHSFYITGGTLSGGAASYVHRRADETLLQSLKEGIFTYILTSRQMGKSSLMVRTAARLRDSGVRPAVLDLTAIGQNLSVEQWYEGLTGRLGRQVGLEDELEEYWESHSRASPMQRFSGALAEVVLREVKVPIVIFVDEIDSVRSLPFSTDEFFAMIRELYTRRATDPDFSRLTFCLLGVATPSGLIRDSRTTPFNIGKRIVLKDFSPVEAAPLADGLNRPAETARQLLTRVLYWTSGQPYLTQRLCQAVAEDTSVQSPSGVDRIAAELFTSARARTQDDNLLFVRDRILRGEGDTAGLLELYGKIRAGKKVLDDETLSLIETLQLSGLVVPRNGYLCVRNRIYEEAFDLHWIKTSMPDAEMRRQKEAFRRGVVRSALAAVLVLFVAGALWRHTQERERVSRLYGQEVERMVWSMRMALLLPLHDIRTDRESVHSRIRAIEETMKGMGPFARGPGLYAIGRGHLALREDEAAEKALRTAWEAGYREPEAAYALGQALGYRYEKEKVEARRIQKKELREARLTEIRREYRDPAIEFLLKSQNATFESPGYVKGLIAFYEEKYAEASAQARRAYETRPSLFEARVLEGQISLALGYEKHARGDYLDARALYGRALTSFSAATDIARSDPLILTSICQTWVHLFELSVTSPTDDPLPEAHSAEDWCARATKADPDAARPFSILSVMRWKWGKIVEEPAGLDPRYSYQLAMDLGREAVRRRPEDASSHTWVAVAAIYWAEYEKAHGLNPVGCFREAADALKKAQAANPYYRVAYNGSAVLGVDLAEAELSRGRDPQPHTKWAIESGRRALELDPTYFLAHESIGRSHLLNARFAFYSGQNPEREIAQASEAFAASGALNPSQYASFLFSTEALLLEAEWAARNGRAPAPVLDLARQAVSKAANMAPEAASYHQGLVELGCARALWRTDGDARTRLAAARSFFNAALLKNQQAAEVRISLSEAALLSAFWLAKQGQAYGAVAEAGLVEAETALRLNPESAEALFFTGALGMMAASPGQQGPSHHATMKKNGQDAVAKAYEANPLLKAAFGEYANAVAEHVR